MAAAAAFTAAAFMAAASPLSTAGVVAPIVSLLSLAGYNCGFGFDSGGYDYGYGNGYGSGNGNGLTMATVWLCMPTAMLRRQQRQRL